MLKKYKYILSQNVEIQNNQILLTMTVSTSKSKYLYNPLKIQKELIPKSYAFWKKEFPEFEFELFYKRKLKH